MELILVIVGIAACCLAPLVLLRFRRDQAGNEHGEEEELERT